MPTPSLDGYLLENNHTKKKEEEQQQDVISSDMRSVPPNP